MKKAKKTSSFRVNILKVLAMVLFITLPFAGFFAGMTYEEMRNAAQPMTYEECITLPNAKIQNSYLATCVTPDGLRFTQSIEELAVPSSHEAACAQSGGTWLPAYNECEGITPEQCGQAGGSFDECASDCRHDPDYPNVYCIQMCVGVCSF